MDAASSKGQNKKTPIGTDVSFELGGAAFLVSFLAYVFTAAPTVCPGDSGELIASAVCLGNVHNPGYPLYAMIGKLFTLIPVGSAAFRVNLMSAFFGSFTVWITYTIIRNATRHTVAALSASLLFAFSSKFWSQTSCAEVYTLHTFFVALIVWLLFRWDKRRFFSLILLLSLIVGLSFSNHLQTVMLAPAVLTFIIWNEPHLVKDTKRLALLAFFFVLGLSLYIYLPIRTQAETAISFGTPNTIDRFIDLVTAADHRHAFLFNSSWAGYGLRTANALRDIFFQYHVCLVFALIGWISLRDGKYRLFWALVILCDIFYTVFLNIVPLKVTAFHLPSMFVLAVLIGHGFASMSRFLLVLKNQLNPLLQSAVSVALLALPVAFFGTHLDKNDHTRNYTAYEYGTNILRSVPDGGILIADGDNNVFPVCYLHLAEGARPDLTLYDRQNQIFKMPFLLKDRTSFSGTWKTLRAIVERELIETRPHIYMAIHNDRDFSAEECKLVPNGLTYRAVPADAYASVLQHQTRPWPYYMEESIHTPLSRDYFTRSLIGYVFLKMGRDLIFMDKHRAGSQLLEKAGSVAYDNPSVQTELARFYTNIGFYTEALGALKAASRFSTDSSEVHSTWGYFYSKQGKFMEAIEAYRRSLKADPNASVTYRNLGVMFLQAGRKEAARNAFYKSLTLDTKQPKLRELIEAKGL